MEINDDKLEWICPNCGAVIPLKRLQDYKIASHWNRLCKKCKKQKQSKKIEKICKCGNHFVGTKKQIYCPDCLHKLASKHFKRDGNGGIIQKRTQEERIEQIRHGIIKNPMYGRSVYSVWLEKYGKEEADRRLEQQKNKMHQTWNLLSEEEKKIRNKKKGNCGNKNPMYGKSVYDVWVEKYGKEEADRRNKEMQRKKSEKNKGKNNPMYGKPAPKGSGNGISGWYKEWYFRSFRELSYMVNVIEKEGHEWRSLDNTPDFRIKYLDKDGHERSYCPDFLIDNKIIVEIKPKKLQGLDSVVRKQNAAIMYCKTRNLVHIITDVEILDFSIIEKMVNDGVVRLTDKSLKKFNQYQRKHHKGECKNENQ